MSAHPEPEIRQQLLGWADLAAVNSTNIPGVGPVDALRFLALVRREPFDDQAWREQSLAGLTVDELFQRLERTEVR